MVVCKFFLQGTCKYGDFCKFDHQINDNFNSYQNQNSTSILRQSHFGTSQQPKPVTNPSNVDTTTLVKSVINDMTSAEKGGQWLLSCYAPYREKPVFPGFEEQSFEELRFGYYEAVKNGTIEQYKQQVQRMLHEAVMKLKSLQSPSPEIVNLLKTIYNTPSSHAGIFGSNTANTSNAFGSSPSTSIPFGHNQPSFGQQSNPSMFSQSNPNIFGKSAQPQNKFVGTSGSIFAGVPQNTSIFGGQTNNSPFGNNQSQSQNKNMFAQASSNFVGPSSGPSIFTGQQHGQATTNLYLGSNQATGGSIFGNQPTGASTLGFVTPQNTVAFAAQPQTNSTSIFTNQNRGPFENINTLGNINQTPFGQPATASNIFGAAPTVPSQATFAASTTMQNTAQQAPINNFGVGVIQPQNQPFSATKAPMFPQPQSVFSQTQQQHSNSPFAQQVKAEAQTHSSSIFGNNQFVGNSTMSYNQVQQLDETLYSKLEDLTEEDIKWFESDDLDNLKIPEKPPTYQMCFKT